MVQTSISKGFPHQKPSLKTQGFLEILEDHGRIRKRKTFKRIVEIKDTAPPYIVYVESFLKDNLIYPSIAEQPRRSVVVHPITDSAKAFPLSILVVKA